MDRIEAFLQLVSAYGAAKGLSDSRISTLVFNHGDRIKKLREGADVRTRNLAKAIAWFDERWPADLEWPACVERPLKVAA